MSADSESRDDGGVYERVRSFIESVQVNLGEGVKIQQVAVSSDDWPEIKERAGETTDEPGPDYPEINGVTMTYADYIDDPNAYLTLGDTEDEQ